MMTMTMTIIKSLHDMASIKLMIPVTNFMLMNSDSFPAVGNRRHNPTENFTDYVLE